MQLEENHATVGAMHHEESLGQHTRFFYLNLFKLLGRNVSRFGPQSVIHSMNLIKLYDIYKIGIAT